LTTSTIEWTFKCPKLITGKWQVSIIIYTKSTRVTPSTFLLHPLNCIWKLHKEVNILQQRTNAIHPHHVVRINKHDHISLQVQPHKNIIKPKSKFKLNYN
jgi:hypothetical protein